MSEARHPSPTRGEAVGLGVWRGALAGALLFVLPTIATGQHPGALAFTVPVASIAGGVMGGLCAVPVLAVVKGVHDRVATLLLAGLIAAVPWIGMCLAVIVSEGFRLNETAWFLTVAPAAIGAAASAWTAQTLRARLDLAMLRTTGARHV